MNGFTRLAITSLLAAAIAVMLSYVPKLQTDVRDQEKHVSVFNRQNPIKLTDDNLVDFLLKIPLKLDIGKVNWVDGAAELSIDLKASSTLKDPEKVYVDLLQMSDYVFFQTSNVRQMLLRIIGMDAQSEGQLLLAMDARREDASPNDLKKLDVSKISMETYLRSKYTLIYTDKWKRQFVVQ